MVEEEEPGRRKLRRNEENVIQYELDPDYILFPNNCFTFPHLF